MYTDHNLAIEHFEQLLIKTPFLFNKEAYVETNYTQWYILRKNNGGRVPTHTEKQKRAQYFAAHVRARKLRYQTLVTLVKSSPYIQLNEDEYGIFPSPQPMPCAISFSEATIRALKDEEILKALAISSWYVRLVRFLSTGEATQEFKELIIRLANHAQDILEEAK